MNSLELNWIADSTERVIAEFQVLLQLSYKIVYEIEVTPAQNYYIHHIQRFGPLNNF